MEKWMNQYLLRKYGRGMGDAGPGETADALMAYVQHRILKRPKIGGKHKIYYMTAEILPGRLLDDDLTNLGLRDEAIAVLAKYGLTLDEIEAEEKEPSLGNGGLGRLAACCLDSAAALKYPCDGFSLRYHQGLFRQDLKYRCQTERGDAWIDRCRFMTKSEERFSVPLAGGTAEGVMWNVEVSGAHGGRNTLHLFDLDTVDDTQVYDGIGFDRSDPKHVLTLFLYPEDGDDAGKRLRVSQQYFMVSCAAQYIIREQKAMGHSLKRLHENAVIHINDTHPSMIIPEMIRLLQLEGLTFDEAMAEVVRSCAFTNHTILSEALEKWPIHILEQAAAPVVPIIRELNRRFAEIYTDPSVRIIDDENVVHMAHLAIHGSFSVNGVAELHTDILEKKELANFFRIAPYKFCSITNGVSFRRWLSQDNRPLDAWIESLIGGRFRTDSTQMTRLMQFADDETALRDLLEIKQTAKRRFRGELYRTQGIDLPEDAIYDVQVKRFHLYKRQSMNLLAAIELVRRIRSGWTPARPIAILFGGKAAASYELAKDVIHAILCLSKIVREDPVVSPHLSVTMIENYDVSHADLIIPASEISEQISTASKEASGTGNQKQQLNGAVTLGTLDGANVEIARLVGAENIRIFGRRADEIIRLQNSGAYRAREYYEKPTIRPLVDFLTGPEMRAVGYEDRLCRLHDDLANHDEFMTLLDLEEYIDARVKLYGDYENRLAWARMSLVNIAQSGYFSSDRTVSEYNRKIWAR